MLAYFVNTVMHRWMPTPIPRLTSFVRSRGIAYLMLDAGLALCYAVVCSSCSLTIKEVNASSMQVVLGNAYIYIQLFDYN